VEEQHERHEQQAQHDYPACAFQPAGIGFPVQQPEVDRKADGDEQYKDCIDKKIAQRGEQR